ncbi:hypothetical protein B0H14DRAFT_3507857 [Mycena olivaceomarginata]|nr:hypothetical protein B0H14DRAFT_3507857 [Mycena olivaceomarginata]
MHGSLLGVPIRRAQSACYWRDVDPKYRFLFRLILAIDANFKMKNRIRAREHNNPSLGPGWGAFVEPTKYKKHLRNYVAEKDISTCIVFAALTQKDTRNTAGLRVSGVGGCVCAQHECMRPNGLGDLQKGERYAKMDYILMSALADFDLQEVTLSYDIACQWIKNFEERMERLPEHLRRDLDAFELQTGLPVWHALAHEDSCASMNSLNYLLGSKEMGLGNPADSLEDKLDSHNFLKNLGEVDSLRCKLIVAIAERARQVAAFKEINKRILPKPRIHWRIKGATEAEIRASLKREEQEAAKKGQAPLHATSATAFFGGQPATRGNAVDEHRLAFTAKLRKFHELQAVYTPAAVRMIQKEEVTARPHLPAPSAEHIRLWLPSELPAAERAGSGCQQNIVDMEAKLREGQAENALSRLHSKRFLINFRNKNLTGQRRRLVPTPSSPSLATASRYRRASTGMLVAALTSLRGWIMPSHLKILKASDLILKGEDARDSLEVGSHARVWTCWRKIFTNHSVSTGSRAKACKSRWDEEVELLREEGFRDSAGGHLDITNDIHDGLNGEMVLPLEEATSSVISFDAG